jgi:hypothetical protein
MKDNIIYIGIIIFLIVGCIFIYWYKNNEISELNDSIEENDNSVRKVAMSLYDNALQELNVCNIHLNELQEQDRYAPLDGLDALADFIIGENYELSELQS